jgi:hypothetical protein
MTQSIEFQTPFLGKANARGSTKGIKRINLSDPFYRQNSAENQQGDQGDQGIMKRSCVTNIAHEERQACQRDRALFCCIIRQNLGQHCQERQGCHDFLRIETSPDPHYRPISFLKAYSSLCVRRLHGARFTNLKAPKFLKAPPFGLKASLKAPNR